MEKRILIFTATYNEVEMIKYYFNELYKLDFIFDLLIIDDNSPDFTWKELEKLQKIHKNFKLIIREKKLERTKKKHKQILKCQKLKFWKIFKNSSNKQEINHSDIRFEISVFFYIGKIGSELFSDFLF